MLNKTKLRKNLLISQFISLFMSFSIFYNLVYFKIVDSNLKAYIILLVSWVFTFTLTFYLLNKYYKGRDRLIKNKWALVLTTAIVVASILLLFIISILNKNVLGKDGEPIDAYILPNFSAFSSLLVIFITLICSKLDKKLHINQKIKTVSYVLMTLVIALYCGIIVYQPNSISIIKSIDFDAYWHSAYLYFNDIGTTLATTSFYGHYGLLLKPIFSLFGFSINTIFMIAVVERVFIVLVLAYLVYETTDSFINRILGLGLILHLSVLSTGVYPQGWDHRIVFSIIFMLLGFLIVKRITKNKDIKVFIAIGYVLNIISIIWNTDFGIIILIAWTILIIAIQLVRKKFSLPLLLVSLLGNALCFLTAWGITSLYNIVVCKSIPIDLKLFLYPLFESNGIGEFTKSIGLKLQPYILVIIFLLIWLGIASVKLLAERDKQYMFPFFVTILCLGRIVYFMNRPAWGNLRLASEQEAIILMVLTMEILIKKYKTSSKGLNLNKAIIIGVIVSQIVIESILIYSTTLYIRPVMSAWKEANKQETYYDSTYFKESFIDDPILLGNGSLYIVLHEKLNKSIVVPNFINCFRTQDTFDILVNEHRPLWVDARNIEYFKGIYSEELINKYFESPIVWISDQMRFYIYYPKQ